MIAVPCRHDGPDHNYSDDWIFSEGGHPGADPRYQGRSYTYYDDRAMPIWVTSVPTCDDHAIDYFTFVASLNLNPIWVAVDRRDEDDGRVKPHMLPWTYDKATDTAMEKTE